MFGFPPLFMTPHTRDKERWATLMSWASANASRLSSSVVSPCGQRSHDYSGGLPGPPMHQKMTLLRHRPLIRSWKMGSLALASLACGVDDRTFDRNASGGTDSAVAMLGAEPLGNDEAGGNSGISQAGGSANDGNGGVSNDSPGLSTSSGGQAAGGSGGSPGELPVPSLAVSVAVQGTGRITSSPAGIDCPGACTASFAAASAVTLSAARIAGSDDYFEGWGGACSRLESCALTQDSTATVSAGFGPANLVFVTSSTFLPGELGGLSGADQLCQSRSNLVRASAAPSGALELGIGRPGVCSRWPRCLSFALAHRWT